MAGRNVVELIMKLKDELSGPLGRFEDRFKRLSSAIKTGALVIGGAIVGLVANSIRLAASMEEMEAKFEAVFKQYAPEARAELERLAETLGRSSNKWIGYAAIIQDTLVPLGYAREDASKLSVEIVALAADLSSFNDIPIETVIRDLQSGLVGNIESLLKYGIVAKDLERNTYALTNGIWDGTGAMNAQEKAAATLGIIYASTSDAQGDAERTADSFTNTMRSAGDQLHDFQIELGQKLLPVIADLVSEHMPGFIDSLENIVPPLVTFVTNVVTLTDAVSSMITAEDQAQEATEMFETQLDGLGNMLTGAVASGFMTSEEAMERWNEEIEAMGSTLPINEMIEFREKNELSTTAIIDQHVAVQRFRDELVQLTLVQLENLRVLMHSMSVLPGFSLASQAAFEQLNAEVTERLMPSVQSLGGVARTAFDGIKEWAGFATDAVSDLDDESDSTGDALEEMGKKGKEAQERMMSGYEQLQSFLEEIGSADQTRQEMINARYDERLERLNEIAEVLGDNAKIEQARYDLAYQREQELQEVQRESRAEGTAAWQKEQDTYKAAKQEAVNSARAMNEALIGSIQGNVTKLGDGLLTLIDKGHEAADEWREIWWQQIKSLIVTSAFKTFANAILGGVGGIAGGILSIFGFQAGGEILHAQSGLQIPHTGPYGDRQLVAVERGEVIYNQQQNLQGMIPGMGGGSTTVNLYNQPTLSTASPGEMVILANYVIEALGKAGVSVVGA